MDEDESNVGNGALGAIPVNFVVLVPPERDNNITADPNIPTATSRHLDAVVGSGTISGAQFFQREVYLINQQFQLLGVSYGSDNVRFKLAGYVYYDEAREIIDNAAYNCSLFANLINPPNENWTNSGNIGDNLLNAVNQCDNHKLVHPKAINIYIFDASTWYNSSANFGATGSHAKLNWGNSPEQHRHPYVFLDWELTFRYSNDRGEMHDGGAIRRIEEHELGHAFGLCHCIDRPQNNIMNSVRFEYPVVSGGISHDGEERYQFDTNAHRTDGSTENQQYMMVKSAWRFTQYWNCQ